jgi:signal transduction histidine kinase
MLWRNARILAVLVSLSLAIGGYAQAGHFNFDHLWKATWFHYMAVGFIVLLIVVLHYYLLKYRVGQLLRIEREQKAENERLRRQMADEFHDELGRKLTNISLFIELLKRSLDAISPRDMEYLNKISDAVKSLSFGIRDFIWALDPNQDSLYDVAIRLRDFGDELFAKSGIAFHVKGICKQLKEVTLPMDCKRHLAIIFKEGMNHILKYVKCKNVTLEIAINHKTVEISLSEDGKGIGKTDFGEESGSRNMKMRADKIRGELNIISNNGNGTTIQFKGQFPQIQG